MITITTTIDNLSAAARRGKIDFAKVKYIVAYNWTTPEENLTLHGFRASGEAHVVLSCDGDTWRVDGEPVFSRSSLVDLRGSLYAVKQSAPFSIAAMVAVDTLRAKVSRDFTLAADIGSL